MRRRFRSTIGLALAAAILVSGAITAVLVTSAQHAPKAATALPRRTAAATPRPTKSSARSVAVGSFTQPAALHLQWTPFLAGRTTSGTPAALPLCRFDQLNIAVRPPASAGYETSAIDVRNVGPSCTLPSRTVGILVGSRPPAPLLPRFGYATTAIPTGATAGLSVEALGCRITKPSAQTTLRLRIGAATHGLRGAIPWPSSCSAPVFQFQNFESDAQLYSGAKSGIASMDVRLNTHGATYSGGRLKYRVQLQANSAVSFTTCPQYVQWLLSPGHIVVQHGHLDCAAVQGLKSAQYLSIGMAIAAPHIRSVPGYILGWSFDGGSGDSLALQTPAELHVYSAAAPAAAPTCTATQLRAVYEQPGGALGTDYADIVLMNESANACAVGGQPAGEFVAYGNGTTVGARAVAGAGGKVAARVLLSAHGGAAVIRSGIADAGDYGPACRSVLGDGIRLFVPNVEGAVFAPFGQHAPGVCTNPDDRQLTLDPISNVRTTRN